MQHKIPERVRHAERYNKKFQSTFDMWDNITQNTRARSTHGKIQHIIFVFLFVCFLTTPMQHKNNTGGKYMTQNSTIPERVPHAEIYITRHFTIPERVPHAQKYNTKFHNTIEIKSKIVSNKWKMKIKGKKGKYNTTHNEDKSRKICNTKYQSALHPRKNITQNTRAHFTRAKNVTQNTRARYTRGNI